MLAKYRLVVMTDATDGLEDEYNDWYTRQHLGDVIAVPGFKSAQRFKLRSLTLGKFTNKYMAIYNIDADDPEKLVEDLIALQGTDRMPMSPALNLDTANVAVFEECSDEISAPDR
ncbi:MAG: hypothetical protein EPO08_09760 [Rhodospirillaceae bacterium]|nr:MAG: hypothetical protein EPO08_09760 [Rhodospirillaceae bacterium]